MIQNRPQQNDANLEMAHFMYLCEISWVIYPPEV